MQTIIHETEILKAFSPESILSLSRKNRKNRKNIGNNLNKFQNNELCFKNYICSKQITNLLMHQSRDTCRHWCEHQGYQFTEFAHWLKVAELNILLRFKYQNCVDIIMLDSTQSERECRMIA